MAVLQAMGTPFEMMVKNGIDGTSVEGATNLPYAIPNQRGAVVIHDTGLRVGYWRSVSHVMNVFANESFIDELAAAYALGGLEGEDRVRFYVLTPRGVFTTQTDREALGEPGAAAVDHDGVPAERTPLVGHGLGAQHPGRGPVGLQRVDDPQLVLRRDAGVDGDVPERRGARGVCERLEFAARDDAGAGGGGSSWAPASSPSC